MLFGHITELAASFLHYISGEGENHSDQTESSEDYNISRGKPERL